MFASWLNTAFATFDGALFNFYHSLALSSSGSFLTVLMHVISAFGKGGIFPIALTVILLLFKKTRKIGISTAIALVINFLFVNLIIKNLVARARPYTVSPYNEWWEFVGAPSEKDKAFPSGHVAAFTTCLISVFLSSKNKKYTWLLIIPTLLMAISRNYLIVHYATDVIAGYALGVGFAIIGYFLGATIIKQLEKHKDNKVCKFLLNADLINLFEKKERKMKIAVLIANGSEEIEALTPVDVLRRTDAECDVVSVNEKAVKCSHGVQVIADKTVEETDLCFYDAIVIPGGMPGATNIAESKSAMDGIKQAIKAGKLVAAICASPAVVLASNGLLSGKATCFPAQDFISALGENYTGADVEACENIITANGPKSAMAFAFAICKYLKLTPKI